MANGILDNLGNGIGYLYVTDPSNNIISNFQNNAFGAQQVLALGLTSAPLSGEVLSFATVNCSATAGTGADQITNITVNGVSIMGAGSVTGATPALLLANAAAAINNAQPTPKYSAFSVGGQLVVQAKTGSGATPNGFVVVVSTAGTVTLTNSNMGGGSITGGIFSTGFNGRRFYINATSGAVQGTISGATEISANVISKNAQSGIVIQGTIAIPIAVVATTTGNALPLIPRLAQTQLIIIDTIAAGPASNLTVTPTSQYVDGDILELRGAVVTDIVTIVSSTGVSGAIQTQAGVPWSSGDQNASIQIQYVAATDSWVEICRTPGLNFSTNSIRGQGIPWAVPGVRAAALVNGASTTLVPGVDKGIQELTGTLTVSSTYSMQIAGGTPLDGDTFVCLYRAIATAPLPATVSIFGSILTATQALSGALRIVSTYVASATAWITTVEQDFTGADWATVASVTAKEPVLGNPAANGYFLSSTTGGARSWVPSPGFIETVQYVTPLTGVTVTALVVSQLISNNGNIAALTIIFPPNPVEGQRFQIAIGGTITTLTLQTSDGSAINGTITTSATNSNGGWVFQTGNGGTWYKQH